MNPKPPFQLRLKQKRLPVGRKAVTVCLAGINHSNPRPYIIATCDRKISFFGGWASADGVAMKISGLNQDWAVMFAGPVSPMTAMVEAMAMRTKKVRPMDFLTFSRLCRKVYREERKPLLENEILGDYDINSYDEYMELKKSDPEFFEQLRAKVREEESEWNLLFAGFDKNGKAHLFVISEHGRISYCDKQGYAAIGSGAMRAALALSSYGFRGDLPLSNAIFGMIAAKFSAESADGVGEETILTVMESRSDQSPVFDSYQVKKLREMWEKLPRFPGNVATEQIWAQLTMFQAFGYWGINNPPTKPSISEKSEQEQ